jgi:hypothetical protein
MPQMMATRDVAANCERNIVALVGETSAVTAFPNTLVYLPTLLLGCLHARGVLSTQCRADTGTTGNSVELLR